MCHGTDLQGGVRDNPSCYQCHPPYPHRSGWRQEAGQPQGHGLYVQLQTSTSCATAHCHGAGLIPVPGITQGISCNACHEAYPHSADWRSGLVHGPVAFRNIALCKGCHGDDLRQAPPGFQTCYDCHPSYERHEAAGTGAVGWENREGHAQYVWDPPREGDLWECQLCHGEDLAGGLSNQSCREGCHPSYPHDPSPTESAWPTYEGHGLYVEGLEAPTALERLAPCQACHGNDLQGGEAGRSCFNAACHVDYPHAVTEAWEEAAHGLRALDPELRVERCGDCHGADLLGRGAAPSCLSCHPSFPHFDEDWGAGQGHVAYLEGLGEGLPLLERLEDCQVCHGADLTGGMSGVSCSSCHFGYPHVVRDDWSEMGHGTSAVGEATRIDRCADCHGADLTGEGGTPSCWSCHTNFPHPESADWTEIQEESRTQCEWNEEFEEENCWTDIIRHVSPHAGQYLAQQDAGFPAPSVNLCRTCHGADYLGGNSGRSCSGSGCHFNYPHQATPNWRTDTGGAHTAAYRAGARGYSSPCAFCHTNLRVGLDGRAPNCYGCHVDFPHLSFPDVQASEDWLLPGRHGWGFIGSEWSDGDSSCAGCHGVDLRGEGDAAKDCASCHEHFGVVSHQGCCRITSQPDGPWRNPSRHGKVMIRARLEGRDGRCNACHATITIDGSGRVRNNRQPDTVCNPYRTEFPASGLDWCSACHTLPAGGCPADGCAAPGGGLLPGDCP